MKRKEAIEYLDKLSDELSEMANEAEDLATLITGMTFGVTHAMMVLEGDAGNNDPHDEAELAVEDALAVCQIFKEMN
jgi:hypothetical protein